MKRREQIDAAWATYKVACDVYDAASAAYDIASDAYDAEMERINKEYPR